MATVTQKHRLVAVKTPLGEDVLVFGRMTARERLGRLFQFDLELFSEDCEIRFKEVLGQPMVVRLELPGERGTRYFHGYVTDFRYRGMNRLRYGVYEATLRPKLWFLTRTADCRIFQNQQVPEIVRKVLTEHGIDVEFKLSGSYRPWEYCVQYRETDFNFVSRLLEQEGIYYYFKHEENKHILVLADSYGAHGKFKGYERIPYFPPDVHDRRERDHLFELDLQASHQPGAYALKDFDFKVPSKDLLATLADPQGRAPARFEIFDYPGEYLEPGEGQTYTGIRLQELLAQYERVAARGSAAGLAVGYLFELSGCPRPDLNREYLIESATHQIESDAYDSVAGSGGAGQLYQGDYGLLDAKQPYRAPRTTPKPVVQGPQTAIVVGPKGEEIYTDQYGRVKVQFHWDREGKKDENSSCWIRVSQVWAGKQWGAIHIPRIDQEVIVDFLEGDPDRPIITGRVYNGASKPPYPLPAGKVVSGIKSDSTKGHGGYNEIVMDDTKSKEKITIHGQYDMNTVIEHDQTLTVHNNRTTKVDGTYTETITKDTKIKIESGSYDHDVAGNTAKYHVSGDITEKYDSKQTTTVGNTITIVSEQANISVKAATKIQLEVGASKIYMDNAGKISIDGVSIAINGSESVNTHGGRVVSKADTQHEIQGTIVKSEAAATNTVKGSMVMLNP